MKGSSMLKVLKLVKPADWIIGAMLLWRMAMIDFNNIWYTDMFCLTAFCIWFGQLCIRLYLQCHPDMWK